MNLKRPAAASDNEGNDERASSTPQLRSSASPRKRSKRDNDAPSSSSFTIPQTPVASGSTTHLNQTASSTSKTPFTPYPLRALDSPSNPFGRKRTEKIKLTLPPVSSFAKHIALRFQFIRSDIPAKKPGVHRVVRVPMNYTFAHLRSLIAWLFNTPASFHHGSTEDYLFEVKNKCAMYDSKYKPGQIRHGSTSFKISNVRDPARWRSGYGCVDEEDELNESGDEEDENQVTSEEEEDWTWADEEDFTIGHLFPRGLDPDIGIIYHHSASTQVHITLNRSLLPRTRGKSNTPHVFFARGRAFLSPAPLPRPNFTKSIQDIMSSSPAHYEGRSKSTNQKKWKGKSKAGVTLKDESPVFSFRDAVRKRKTNTSGNVSDDEDAEGELDPDADVPHAFDASHPFFHAQGSSPVKRIKDADDGVILVRDSDDEEDDEGQVDWTQEDFNTEINPDKWNRNSRSFAIYLLRFNDPTGEYDDEEVKEDDIQHSQQLQHVDNSTPGLTNCASSASSLPPSSPMRSSSPATLEYYFPNSSSYSLPDPSEFGLIIETHYPANKKYSATPAPPKAKKHRLRIKRLEKRLAKIKKDAFLTKNDGDNDVLDGEEDELDEEEDDSKGGEKVDKWVALGRKLGLKTDRPGARLAMTEKDIWGVPMSEEA
ncbi:hypothetical protein CPC08DRAFT_685074 [Agrocybe pediades]|nr:hypothetical protein CPC08DRAFT_685074 [Agrocybe pediades]